MTLGRKDFSVSRTDGGANVFRLAGFLRDDDLIDHDGLGWTDRFDAAELEHIANTMASQPAFPKVVVQNMTGVLPPIGGVRLPRCCFNLKATRPYSVGITTIGGM